MYINPNDKEGTPFDLYHGYGYGPMYHGNTMVNVPWHNMEPFLMGHTLYYIFSSIYTYAPPTPSPPTNPTQHTHTRAHTLTRTCNIYCSPVMILLIHSPK